MGKFKVFKKYSLGPAIQLVFIILTILNPLDVVFGAFPELNCIDSNNNPLYYNENDISSVDCWGFIAMYFDFPNFNLIQQYELSEYTELKYLKLSSSASTTVPENLIVNLRKLEIFELEGGDIKELPANFFLSQVNLKKISLTSDAIISIKPEWFRTTTSLTEFFFMGDGLAHISGFGNMSNLVNLTLVGKKLSTIQGNALSGLGNLLRLGIGGTNLTTLPENLFSSQRNLESLVMDTNPITELPSNIFISLYSLKELVLGYNKIMNLKPQWFIMLRNLSLLDVQSNQIGELPPGVFNYLQNLEILYLSENKIKIIHSTSFGMHPKLSYIAMNSNQIDAFDERLFKKLPKFTEIYFEGNLCAGSMLNTSDPATKIIMDKCFKNYKAIVRDCFANPSANIVSGRSRRCF